jgi:GTPase SAR1 family protein
MTKWSNCRSYHHKIFGLLILFDLLQWDTAGQERSLTITTSYYRGAMCIIVAYDTTNRASFQNITKWLDLVKTNGSAGTPVFIVGAKEDLTSKRAIKLEEGQYFAYKHGCKCIPNFFNIFFYNVFDYCSHGSQWEKWL